MSRVLWNNETVFEMTSILSSVCLPEGSAVLRRKSIENRELDD